MLLIATLLIIDFKTFQNILKNFQIYRFFIDYCRKYFWQIYLAPAGSTTNKNLATALVAFLLNLFFNLGLYFVWPALFDLIYSMKAHLKFTMHLYKVFYNLYLVRNGQRSEHAEPFPPAHTALAKAYASLTAFCLHTIAYYIA